MPLLVFALSLLWNGVALGHHCSLELRAHAAASAFGPPTLGDRSAGVQLAISSLPGPYARGDFGAEAYAYIDSLYRSGQRWWPLLPLNPTDEVGSPYKSSNSFAIDVAYLSIDGLVAKGLISREFAESLKVDPGGPADLPLARKIRNRGVREALRNLADAKFSGLRMGMAAFQKQKAEWLDFHVAMELKHSGVSAAQTVFGQYILDEQLKVLRAYANRKGIALVGDLPIYVARGSVDAAAFPEAFLIDGDGNPLKVSGYPPCNVYKDGQLWDTLLYDYCKLLASGYRYWVARLQRMYELYDVVRVDHFLGLDAFYAIDAGAQTAAGGEWIKAGGAQMLDFVAKALGPHRLIAEDLGSTVPPTVLQMRKAHGIPGMKIWQFGYGRGGKRKHRPAHYQPEDVAYPATHDMNTLAGFLEEHGRNTDKVFWGAIASIYHSNAGLVFLQAQDVLRLGQEHRMNVPGTWSTAPRPEQRRDNWVWRLPADAWTPEVEQRLRRFAEESGRVARP